MSKGSTRLRLADALPSGVVSCFRHGFKKAECSDACKVDSQRSEGGVEERFL